MKTKLDKMNGWQRLWFTTSILWIIGFTVFVMVIGSFPAQDNVVIFHEDLLKELSAKSVTLIAKEGDIFDQVANFRKIEMLPNGMSFSVPANTNEKDVEFIRADHLRVIDNHVTKKRIRFVLFFLAVCFGPCIATYSLGVAFKWIRDGFKTAASPQS